jgi:hypothetical protein
LRLGSVSAEFNVADGVTEHDLVTAMLGVAAVRSVPPAEPQAVSATLGHGSTI